MKRLLASSRLALVSVLVIWVLARLYPLSQTEPLMNPEVWSARKLVEYGFWERQGGRINMAWATGRLPNPQDYNYTHYPMPVLWVFTAIYYLTGAGAGPWVIVGLVVALKLAGCALVFKILDRHFDRFPAWLGAVLFAVAPCSILLDCETDLVAMGALLWPAGAWLLLRRNADGLPKPPRPWMAGGLMFLGGQVSWFTLTLVPSLMALTESWTRPLRDAARAVARNRIAWAVLAGGVASFLFFLAQVIFYQPDFPALVDHLKLKMGGKTTSTVSRSLLFTLVPLRLAAFTGVALLAGIVAGLWHLRERRPPLVVAAVIYLFSLTLAAVAIPHYFYMDNIVFGSLLFPAAVLTAHALQHTRRRGLTWLLAALALPGLLYAQLIAAVPGISPTARIVGKFIADHTEATDMVATNLELGRPPFKPSDVSATKAVRLMSDRMIFFGRRAEPDLNPLPALLKRTEFPLIYVRNPALPLSPELLERLRIQARLVAVETLALPSPTLTLVEEARAFVWIKVMRKGAPPPEDERNTAQVTLEVYRLQPHANSGPARDSRDDSIP